METNHPKLPEVGSFQPPPPRVRIYLISLEKDVQRREQIKKRFPRTHMHFERITGIDGATLDEHRFKLLYPMSKNEIGCTLSHLQAYEKFLHSGEDACIILEDDVIGSDDDVEQALLIASRFIDESIVLLGGLQGLRNKRYVIGEQVNNHERLYKISKLSKRFLARTCCYTITKKTAAILLDKQHTMMLRADDWQRLLSDTKKIYYADLFSHPIEKESSNIEISRKSLKPGFLGQLIKDGLVYTIQSQLLKLLITTLPSKKKVPIKYI